MDFGPDGYVVGWFTLALINACLAQGKHTSGLVAFLWSIFIGPFATLYIAIFIEDEHRHNNQGDIVEDIED